MGCKCCGYGDLPQRDLQGAAHRRQQELHGRGSSVAVYKVRTFNTLKHITHTIKDSGSDVSDILPLLHDIEVVIGAFAFEDSEHLVEHLPVLTSDAYNGFKLV